MREWIWQKYSWWKLFFLFAGNIVKNPFKGVACWISGEEERSAWWYKETIDSYYWLMFHLKYKSKRIK